MGRAASFSQGDGARPVCLVRQGLNAQGKEDTFLGLYPGL